MEKTDKSKVHQPLNCSLAVLLFYLNRLVSVYLQAYALCVQPSCDFLVHRDFENLMSIFDI
jgi:hypothetical protein